jgi:hypothetical protein
VRGTDPQARETKEDHADASDARRVSSAIVGAVGQSGGNETASSEVADPVEAALADALTKASAAGQWTVVETLSRELTARREARAGVVTLDVERAKRGRS